MSPAHSPTEGVDSKISARAENVANDALKCGEMGDAMNYILQCSTIARHLFSSVLDGGTVFLLLLISSLFLTSQGIGPHRVGADFGLVALLSLSAIVATCAACASDSWDARFRGTLGLRSALTQGMRAAAAGALIALPLSYAYGMFSRSPAGAAPSLAQISVLLVPASVFLSQFLQRFMRPYGRTQRRIVVVGDRSVEGRIASQRQIAREIVGFLELGPDEPLAGGEHRSMDDSASRLERFLEQAKPDEVVVASSYRHGNVCHAEGLPVWDLLRAKANGLRVVDFAGFWERETGRIDLLSLDPAWLLFGPGLRGNARFLFFKRVTAR